MVKKVPSQSDFNIKSYISRATMSVGVVFCLLIKDEGMNQHNIFEWRYAIDKWNQSNFKSVAFKLSNSMNSIYGGPGMLIVTCSHIQ